MYQIPYALTRQTIDNIKKYISTYAIHQCLSGDDCQTEGGQRCIFPFDYEGTTYHKCTSVDNDQPWCAYEVDSEGILVEDEWDNCGNTCYPGKYIAFAFVYDIDRRNIMKCVHIYTKVAVTKSS